MLKGILGKAATRKEPYDPDNALDARLERAFLSSEFLKFKGLLSVILQDTPQEKLPYATFERIIYKAATMGLENYCTLLLPHTSGKGYLDGSLNNFAMTGNLEGMETFLGYGANIHNHEDQPLRSAIIGREQGAVDFLRDRGCDLSVAMNSVTIANIQNLHVCDGALIIAFLSVQEGWEGLPRQDAPGFRAV